MLYRNDYLIVILPKCIYKVKLATLTHEDQIETWDNPNGIGDASYDKTRFVLVTMGTAIGNVQIRNLNTSQTLQNKIHDSEISFIGVDKTGMIGASVNALGTIIRVFS